ncbi:ABC transporter permease [candidate division KSB1 bacterium]|nr:ABC transporter permease [candidate division KSB1 bacterium]
MKAVLTIALQSLRIIWKDKTSVVWMLIIPTAYIFFFGNAFKYDRDPTRSTAYLGVYNQDDGLLGRALIDGIKSENIHVDSLAEMPTEITTRILVIPPDFTVDVLAENKTELQFRTKSGSNIEAEMAAELAIRKSYIRLLADMVELKARDDSVTINNINAIKDRERLVLVNSSYAGTHKIIPTGYNQQVPANIVMFTMLIIFIYAGHMVLDEKRAGIFRRIIIAPVDFWQIFLGKLAGGTLIGLGQIFILVIIGNLVFGVYYGPSLVAVLLLSLFFAASVASVGLTLGMLIHSEEKLTGVAIILAIAMSAISGCWWPLEISPLWMVKIASFLPSGIALAGFHQLISYGRGLDSIIAPILKLASISLLFAFIFAFLLRKRDK